MQKPFYIIRSITQQDVEATTDLLTAVFWSASRDVRFYRAMAEKSLRKSCVREEKIRTFVAADQNNRVVGSVTCLPTLPMSSWLHTIYSLGVAPADRCRGIATALMEYAEKHVARVLGVKSGYVLLGDETHSDFYFKRGYTKLGGLAAPLADIFENFVDARLMIKRVKGSGRFAPAARNVRITAPR